MKKNIALFMAGALAMSTLPFNVFAASTNTVSNQFVGHNGETFTSDAAVQGDYYAPYMRFVLKDDWAAGDAIEIELDNASWAEDYDSSSIIVTQYARSLYEEDDSTLNGLTGTPVLNGDEERTYRVFVNDSDEWDDSFTQDIEDIINTNYSYALLDALNYDGSFDRTPADAREVNLGSTVTPLYNSTDASGLFSVDVDGGVLTVKPLVSLSKDMSIIIPAFGEFDSGETVTATIDPGHSPITGGTLSLTNHVEGSLTFSSDKERDLTIDEDIAGALNVNELLYVQIIGSKAQWVHENVEAVSGYRFNYDDALETRQNNWDSDADTFQLFTEVADYMTLGTEYEGTDDDGNSVYYTGYRWRYGAAAGTIVDGLRTWSNIVDGEYNTSSDSTTTGDREGHDSTTTTTTGSDAGYSRELVINLGVQTKDHAELSDSNLAQGFENNGIGLRGTMELDFTKVLALTDRDYRGEIDVYIWGAGIDEDDKQRVTIYDTTSDIDAYIEDDEVPELISGRVEQEAGEVVIEELYDGALRDDRYIKFELKNAEFTMNQTIEASNPDDSIVVNPEKDTDGNFTQIYIDKDTFEFDNGEKNEITLTPEINIDAEYEGDIVMTISGPGVSEEFELVIATTKAPISVEAEVTHIKAGFTNIPTADITITENFAGALTYGEYFVGVNTEQIESGLKISDIEEGLIESGDMEIDVTAYTLTNEDGDTEDGILLDIVSDTQNDEAGEFTLSGIEIYADSTVPTSKDAFELYVRGNGVGELETYTYTHLSTDVTKQYFYEFDYMSTGNLDNESNANNASSVANLNSKVAITLGETSYTVEGEYYGELIAPAYVSNSGSTMIPVRALSYALGVSEDKIFWHQATQTVTIEVSSTRTAQFTLGSDLCTINGIQYPIVSASGSTDVVESKDGYTYLPLRFIGEKVFGVTVDWDNATQTATFN